MELVAPLLAAQAIPSLLLTSEVTARATSWSGYDFATISPMIGADSGAGYRAAYSGWASWELLWRSNMLLPILSRLRSGAG